MTIRTPAIAIFALSAMLAAGCGGGEEETEPAADQETQTETTALEPTQYASDKAREALTLETSPENVECQVGLSWNGATHPYGATSIRRTEEAAEALPNMDLFVADARGDASTQTSQVNDLIARGIDVLIVSPADAEAIAPAVRRAQEEGIDVIASDRTVEGADVLTFVGSNNVEAGRVAGEHVGELLSDGGNVVELQGSLGASPTRDRHRGFASALEGTGVEVVASPSANYDRAEGLQVMEDMLQRFGSGDIDVVFAHNDEMALGAMQAIQEAGRGDEIEVVGIDGQESALEAVEAGDMNATVVYPITATEHTLAAANACADEELPEQITLESPLVTQDNVDQFKGTTF